MKNDSLQQPIAALLSLIVLLLPGCVNFNDFEGLEVGDYEGTFAVPLFQSQVSFQDLLNEVNNSTYITVEPDGAMVLSYFNDPQIRRTQDIFAIIPVFGALLKDTINTIPFELPEEMDIAVMTFDQGDIAFNFKSFHEEDLTVSFILPQLSRNGQVFQRTFSVDYAGTVPVEKTGVFSLVKQNFKPENDSLIIRYVATRNSNGQRDTLTDVQMGVVNLEFSYADGFLGTETYPVDSGRIEMDFFQDLPETGISFDDPRIVVKAQNSFGFPVRSNTRKMTAVTADGTMIPLENEAVTNGINFNYPSFEEIGKIKYTEYILDKSNSNILDLIKARPQSIEYIIDVITNPDDAPLQTGYMTDSSIFSAQLGIEIPLKGTLTNYLGQDTFPVSFQSFKNIREMEFKVIAENEIPLQAILQCYFLDEQLTLLDSLSTDQKILLEAASVDEAGQVKSPKHTTAFLTISASQFDRLKTARALVTKTRFTSTKDGVLPVQFNAFQSLKLKAGVKAIYQQ